MRRSPIDTALTAGAILLALAVFVLALGHALSMRRDPLHANIEAGRYGDELADWHDTDTTDLTR